MSIIFDVIHEEYQRLKQLSEKYEIEIRNLPKGSIQRKKRNGKYYIYLSYRNKDKVICKYIGKGSSPKVQDLTGKIELRKDYEKKLKEIKKEIKEVRKVINGKTS